MEQNISLSSPLKRITILDALRGFALLGVILMHMIQHFGIFSMPSQQETFQFPAWDETIQKETPTTIKK
ncbi:heparan-alpha-glucosaminide N-acetyltransferase domain-containing protein [Anaerophaga thermohalophila]|uniref:heparan-alpha-glucosaminide N-acetyltransferase domain-containing protein n=1 Tax=Anaerophaga thermohalophila TaxID=177400 RepID=UPI0002DA89FA|nr:heparan-alpha-glucosaminide N-acetyltransferase domain-containing protein [Anaerophaga thermohalophila]